MDEIVHRLTSSTKIILSTMLTKPMSPEDMASMLNITRQAVDKHVKEMQFYGIVEKIWVTAGKRPRVEFKLSQTGSHFYSSMKEFIEEFRVHGREDLENQIKDLDLQLIDGNIDQVRYLELKGGLEQSMKWFISDAKT